MPDYHIEIDETGGFIFQGICGDVPSNDNFHFVADRKVFHDIIDAIFDGEVLQFKEKTRRRRIRMKNGPAHNSASPPCSKQHSG